MTEEQPTPGEIVSWPSKWEKLQPIINRNAETVIKVITAIGLLYGTWMFLVPPLFKTVVSSWETLIQVSLVIVAMAAGSATLIKQRAMLSSTDAEPDLNRCSMFSGLVTVATALLGITAAVSVALAVEYLLKMKPLSLEWRNIPWSVLSWLATGGAIAGILSATTYGLIVANSMFVHLQNCRLAQLESLVAQLAFYETGRHVSPVCASEGAGTHEAPPQSPKEHV